MKKIFVSILLSVILFESAYGKIKPTRFHKPAVKTTVDKPVTTKKVPQTIIRTAKGNISMKNLTPEQKEFIKNLPKTGGTYEFPVNGTSIPYTGQTKDMQRRIKEHISKGKIDLDKVNQFEIKTRDIKDMPEEYNEIRRGIHEKAGIQIRKLQSEIENETLPNKQIPKKDFK